MLIHRTLAIRAPSNNLSIDAHQLVLDSSNPASPTQDHVDPGSAGSAIQNSSQLAAECITRSNSMGPNILSLPNLPLGHRVSARN